MTRERINECRRIISARFAIGEYDYVGRDLLMALDVALVERDAALDALVKLIDAAVPAPGLPLPLAEAQLRRALAGAADIANAHRRKAGT